MPILDNPKHEAFIQEYVRNGSKNATQAYIAAGYSENEEAARRAASRLLTNVDVQARKKEIQKEIQASDLVTTAGIIAELEQIREQAIADGQYSAAAKCVELKGKTIGAFTDKVESNNKSTVFTIQVAPEEADI